MFKEIKKKSDKYFQTIGYIGYVLARHNIDTFTSLIKLSYNFINLKTRTTEIVKMSHVL